MKVLAEIPARSSSGLRTGTLRRTDQEAYGEMLEELRGARSVLMTGPGTARREVATGFAAAAAAAGTRTAPCSSATWSIRGWPTRWGSQTRPGCTSTCAERRRSRMSCEPSSSPVPVRPRRPSRWSASPAGRPSPEGPRLLASDAFARAVAGLRAAYELVVIVGPPLRDEISLTAVLALVDSTVACLGPSEPRKLPISVTGLVIQN